MSLLDLCRPPLIVSRSDYRRKAEELNKKVALVSDKYYKQAWSSIALLDEVVSSPPSEFKEKAEAFISHMLKQD
ncbi:hypothetical protein HanOQP8_Chr15g0590621 [Helianthus annuus]|nr:hypothetical protein HanOQP8_Chr15g0590621 [Helianthus annuus]